MVHILAAGIHSVAILVFFIVHASSAVSAATQINPHPIYSRLDSSYHRHRVHSITWKTSQFDLRAGSSKILSPTSTTLGATTNMRNSLFQHKIRPFLSARSTFLVSFLTLSLWSVQFHSPDSYPTHLLLRDQAACLATVVLATVFVKACTIAARRDHGILTPHDARKTIHTFSVPFFLLCWPLYSDVGAARYFASLIMVVVFVRLLLAGTATKSKFNSNPEAELAHAVSRTGNPSEALGGPMFYALSTWMMTVLFWRDSLTGIVSMCIMAAGDGMADLIGRRWGTHNRWPFCPDKSVAGTLAFFLGSTCVSLGIVLYMQYTTPSFKVDMNLSLLVSRVCLICALSAIVELLPLGNDNLTVPMFAVMASKLLLE